MLTDIYADKNAYYAESTFKRVPKPAARDMYGNVRAMMETTNRMELVLGTKGRSAEQFDIWQAVYSPQGADGYPQPIWDKVTGEIDKEVAEYWRENFDLRHILERDWETLWPKVRGKLHIYCGTMDNFVSCGLLLSRSLPRPESLPSFCMTRC
eukprot:SAG22_NODE_506_length_9643_cov_5.853206_9_plen_153_part_00